MCWRLCSGHIDDLFAAEAAPAVCIFAVLPYGVGCFFNADRNALNRVVFGQSAQTYTASHHIL